MKTPSVSLIALLAGALAAAGLFAYRQAPNEPAVPTATIETGHSVKPEEPTSAAAVANEDAPSASPQMRNLAQSGVFRSYRLTPRPGPLALPPPAPRAPAGAAPDTPASLQGSAALSTKPEQRAKVTTASETAPAPIEPEHRHPAPEAPDAEEKRTPPATTFAFGAGINRLPRWQGSAKSENRPIPYIDINWRDQVEFSTVKGLIIDVLHGERWHGGLIGTLVWGRSSKDLAGLQVRTLQNTVQGGVYLEYALTPQATLGIRWRHDLQNTRVSYSEIYGELELPKVGYLEHDLRLSLEGMNQAGMRRFFGVSPQEASLLGSAPYQPGAGTSKLALTYEGFQPTSESTGIAFGATIGRLTANPGNSPLVRNFGARTQKEMVLAFLYHF